MVVPAYPGHVVLRIKYNQTCFPAVLIFNALHCIKVQKFGIGFFGVNFWSRDFLGLLEDLGIFLGFDFCPHSIIPIT